MTPAANELVRREDTGIVRSDGERLTNVQRLGGLLAASGYFADAREMAQAAVKVMAGEELGIPPIAAMMGINIIKGKIALSGNLIASRIRAHGYDYKHKRFDANGCVLEFLSKADAKGNRTLIGESSFTEEDAKLAGAYGEMYRKYPRNMYFNRAVSNGAKWFCPEVFAGAPVYTPEELGASVDEQGDYVAPETPVAVNSISPVGPPTKPPVVAEMPQRPPSDNRHTPSPENANVDQKLVKWLQKLTGPKEIIAEFGVAKQTLAGLTGDDLDYYSILGKFGMAHANQFRTVQNARACATLLYREIVALKAKQAEAPPQERGDAYEEPSQPEPEPQEVA